VYDGAGYDSTNDLMGANIASPSLLLDEQGETCIFFSFHSLAIRRSGTYRLRFSLFDLHHLVDPNSGKAALAIAYSDIFTVYSPRFFPGVLRMKV
jgi:Velvet factor